MIVQIYGFTTPADVEACRDLCIDHMGVVLDEGLGAWDQVDADTATAVMAAIPAGTKRVGLSLGTDYDRIVRTAEMLEPDVLHVVRAVGNLSGADLARVRDRLGGVEIMTTIAVRDASAVDDAVSYAPCSDFLLLDSCDPATGVVGATGRTHDWATSARIPPLVDVPVVLAGGLGPDNVAAAIAAVGPAGVDSETRTSRSDDRRRKDIAALRRFVETVRALERSAP